MKSVFANWRLFLCLGLVFLLPCDRVAGQDNDHFAWTHIASAHFVIMSPPLTKRYVRQIKDAAGTLFTCYLFADDENIGRSDKRRERTGLGMLEGRERYKLALYRKGWKSPQVQNVELFGSMDAGKPSDGNGTIYLNPPSYSDFPLLNSVFILHGPGSGQPDILVVQEDFGNNSSLTLTSKRVFLIHNDKLVPILCKVPGRPASVGDYGSNSLNGEDEKYIPLHVEPFGPFRFKSSFNNVGASVINLDVKDKRIGEFEDIWLFSPDRHLLIRESRRRTHNMRDTAYKEVNNAIRSVRTLINAVNSEDWKTVASLFNGSAYHRREMLSACKQRRDVFRKTNPNKLHAVHEDKDITISLSTGFLTVNAASGKISSYFTDDD